MNDLLIFLPFIFLVKMHYNFVKNVVVFDLVFILALTSSFQLLFVANYFDPHGAFFFFNAVCDK